MDETQLVTTLVTLLKTAGPWTAASLAGVWAAIRVARWVAGGCSSLSEKVLSPLVQSVTTFIGDVNETQKAHAQTLRDVSASLQDVHETQKEHSKVLQNIHAATKVACRYPGGQS